MCLAVTRRFCPLGDGLCSTIDRGWDDCWEACRFCETFSPPCCLTYYGKQQQHAASFLGQSTTGCQPSLSCAASRLPQSGSRFLVSVHLITAEFSCGIVVFLGRVSCRRSVPEGSSQISIRWVVHYCKLPPPSNRSVHVGALSGSQESHKTILGDTQLCPGGIIKVLCYDMFLYRSLNV